MSQLKLDLLTTITDPPLLDQTVGHSCLRSPRIDRMADTQKLPANSSTGTSQTMSFKRKREDMCDENQIEQQEDEEDSDFLRTFMASARRIRTGGRHLRKRVEIEPGVEVEKLVAKTGTVVLEALDKAADGSTAGDYVCRKLCYANDTNDGNRLNGTLPDDF